MLDTSVAIFDTLLCVVNSWNMLIRIQAIERDKEVPFLDLALSKLDKADERGLSQVMHRTFRKKLNICGYVPASSEHHVNMTESTIRGETIRLLRPNSRCCDYERELLLFRRSGSGVVIMAPCFRR